MVLKKKKVKILGAGISGLIAAIMLARNGFEVEVFEKRSRVGSFFKRDVHSLRNYYYNYDIIKKYNNLKIKISHVYPIFKEFRFSPSLKKLEIYSKEKPLFYNFIRGYDGKRSFDVELYEKAKKLGVRFYFNKILNSARADIIATGFRSIKGVAYGVHYDGVRNTKPHSIYIFLNNNYAPNGYSYILPFYNEASVVIASTKKQTRNELKENFNNLISNNLIIKDFLRGAKFKNEIFGYIFYDFPKTAVRKSKLYVGEAAGFLDAATGFGTHYAILSGYLAAEAIIKNKNYDKLWEDSFKDELEKQYFQRARLQNFNNKKYEKSIKAIIAKYGNKITADSYKKIKLK